MDQGLERAGLTPIWMCEIDRQCREVLRFHYPALPVYHDMTNLDVPNLKRPNVFCGGTPCTGFSVAGLRESLDDNRSNLCLTFLKLANALNPDIILWENVPGVLSTHDNAFGCFLAGLVGADAPLVPPDSIRRWKVGKSGRYFSWPDAGMVAGSRRVASWRVLDTQFFDCPQRRERVFVVCDTGDFSSSKILFEPKSLQGDYSQGEETREGVAYSLSPSLSASGRGTEPAGESRGQDCVIPVGPQWPAKIAPILNAHLGDKRGLEDQHALNGGAVRARHPEIAMCLNAHQQRIDMESETLIATSFHENQRGEVTENKTVGAIGNGGGKPGQGYPAIITHTLTGNGFDASEDGTGRGTPLVPVAYRTSGNCGVTEQGDKTAALNTASDPNQTIITFQPRIGRNGHGSEMAQTGIVNALNSPATDPGDAAPCVAIRTAQTSSNGCGIDESGTSYTLDGAQGQAVGSKYGVRRLLAIETERLQGWPDNWTLKAVSEKTGEVYEQTDSPRYKQCGNGVTATVAEFIGRRIVHFLSQKPPINSEK